ncbi:2OG-Fe(II) oxygenase [Synechococcus sp. PCC 6312]|uniref:2OG-Fe(II) oxygenase n=1 Tax=Synechococcus sp. (strain ATCC 27167 / PCC 6312) TaxID=195253 RepID=UPI00029F40BF|nr:2OG-Fe(II) oxygenase [Synechococcus sp. PCC 6312]AFY60691.1 Peroxiredoxin [Synechococcus sp. PCC 6312]
MARLLLGEPAPWFTLPSSVNPQYNIDTVGGHRTILLFLGHCSVPTVKRVLEGFLALQTELATAGIPLFAISIDPHDQPLQSLVDPNSYCKFLWDFERDVSRLYGVIQTDKKGQDQYHPQAFILNQRLQIVGIFPIQGQANFPAQIVDLARKLPPDPPLTIATPQAPVLFVPHLLEPSLCQKLIALYEADGGRPSGFMRQVDGKTVEIMDDGFKRRRDLLITDEQLLAHLNALMARRLRPEIRKAFQFDITRFERYLVACYEEESQGFFNRHRDDTTKGTAHRRFAMTLNLNTGDYEGGYLRFPEFGPHLYRPGVGEAVIFSCSLLHEATPVTQGGRYVLLNFFYDEPAAQIRSQNLEFVLLSDSPPSPATKPEQ